MEFLYKTVCASSSSHCIIEWKNMLPYTTKNYFSCLRLSSFRSVCAAPSRSLSLFSFLWSKSHICGSPNKNMWEFMLCFYAIAGRNVPFYSLSFHSHTHIYTQSAHRYLNFKCGLRSDIKMKYSKISLIALNFNILSLSLSLAFFEYERLRLHFISCWLTVM
jgi:Na+/melibiose symporter-like transporter